MQPLDRQAAAADNRTVVGRLSSFRRVFASTFRRGFASTLGFNLVARGMSALTLVVLLRALSTNDFAFVVLLLNVGQFMGSAATGGIRLRYARLEAERVSRGHEEPSAFYATVLSGNGLIVIVAAAGLVIATLLGIGSDGERLTFIALTTAFTLGTATVEMTIYHHQAQLAFVRAGVLEVIRNAIILITACAAAAGLLSSGAAVSLAFAIAVAILAVIVSAPLAFATRGAVRGKEGRFGFGRETVSLTLYSMASAGWAFLDLFLVAGLLNDVSVASYGAALRYISIVMGPVPALIAILRVRTAQRDMIDSEESRREMMRRWVRQTTLPAIVITVGGALAAIWLIPLVNGDRYPLSVPIFQILMLLTLVQYILLPTPGLLIAQQRYSVIAWVNVVAVAGNVAAAVVAAPLFGVIGIAVAGCVVGIGQAAAVAWFALRPGTGEPSAAAMAAGEEIAEEVGFIGVDSAGAVAVSTRQRVDD